VPHAVTVLTSKCTEGSGVGFKKEPPVLSEANIVNPLLAEDHGLLAGAEELDLSFICQVAEGVDVGWRARLLPDKRLLLHVSSGALPEGSRECFVRILEYAEEDLECSEILVEFEKDRKDRPLLVKTFMYFGFTMLTPDKASSLVGPARIVMVYTID
jgi:hypothetical protein